MDYIKVENLAFSYDAEPVLQDINFTVKAGEFVILTGENGAAKSTLLKSVLGLLKPQEGTAKIAPTNIHGNKMMVGYAPQQISSFNIGFPSKVLEFVESGRYQNNRWFKRLDQEDKEHVRKALESTGMWDLRHKKIGELSGGQKQRIALARIFATDPDLFVLDEPTTGMDKESRERFYRLLRHNSKVHNKAILMVTHEHEDIKTYMDRQIILRRKEDSPWRCFSMDSCSGRSKPQP
ncbi:High-affinity zinc uptake system ATP-binding protein ZnuC [Jeotgalibaca dankookensis]|uniref:High-affinity zinc uptake system ATP-binding protein ZnuC n=1 Tax=Jeotgalibaca dankookensis TaxID=708126 RepID=A0A1S6IQV1_9LACT|nr:metal ABC transporter ATP-binding protein [Jeotgalibaca dankookensis]AQS53860.1 High-affinity zinc uptake system ATP-binding protein ZnuC [Jeotgalibaca dankookensis]